MALKNQIRLTACCLFLSTTLFAAKITGKVTNGTTNKASAGDDVVLLSLSGGMQETARATTNSKGEFSLDLPDEGVQHLVRVTHNRVNYFHPAPQGSTTADVTVYDAAKKIDNLIGEGRVFRVQSADGQQLQVSDMYILRNESKPPRTWMGERTFEITLPEGATIEDGMAEGPGGMPVTSAPVPAGIKNHYAFIFPIRPGQTRLQVVYKLPYNGSHDFSVSPDQPLAEFGVMLPKGIRFTPTGENFSPASDESGMTVFVAKSISPGQQLKFSLTGEGTAPREAQGNGNMGGAEGAAAGPGGSGGGPGGGLGTPIGAPDPLSTARWYILGFVLAGLAGGAVWMIRRKPLAQAASAGVSTRHFSGNPDSNNHGTTPAPANTSFSSPGHSPPQSSLLEALKEELFQLESDRVEGKISQQDYDAAKNGLGTLLRRQMKKTD